MHNKGETSKVGQGLGTVRFAAQADKQADVSLSALYAFAFTHQIFTFGVVKSEHLDNRLIGARVGTAMA